MTTTPEEFARAFARLWSMRDASGLAALAVEDAEMLTLTGVVCEDRKTIAAVLEGELAGTFAGRAW